MNYNVFLTTKNIRSRTSVEFSKYDAKYNGHNPCKAVLLEKDEELYLLATTEADIGVAIFLIAHFGLWEQWWDTKFFTTILQMESKVRDTTNSMSRKINT